MSSLRTTSTESVELTLQVAGAERVMFGTDYPFDVGDPEAKRSLPAILRQDECVQSLILSGNALAALNGAKRSAASASRG